MDAGLNFASLTNPWAIYESKVSLSNINMNYLKKKKQPKVVFVGLTCLLLFEMLRGFYLFGSGEL